MQSLSHINLESSSYSHWVILIWSPHHTVIQSYKYGVLIIQSFSHINLESSSYSHWIILIWSQHHTVIQSYKYGVLIIQSFSHINLESTSYSHWITAKTQSGGDFVCFSLQKIKIVWLTLFLFEMILWCMGYATSTGFCFLSSHHFSNWLSLPQGKWSTDTTKLYIYSILSQQNT
jgi:hypothetical protein